MARGQICMWMIHDYWAFKEASVDELLVMGWSGFKVSLMLIEMVSDVENFMRLDEKKNRSICRG